MVLLLSSMKAIVLAAGYGTRLVPLTHYLPKPLIPVLGKPLLWHILTRLKKCGITDAGVNMHHHADMVREFLKTQNPGMPVTISHEPEILGVAGGIGAFRDFVRNEEYFMLHNGDVLSTIPLGQMAAAFLKKRPLIGMVLHDHPPYNNVCTAEDGSICDLRDTLKPPASARRLAYTGIAFMDRKVLDFIPEHRPCDLIPICLDIIREGRYRIEALIAEGHAWCDVGTVQSYFEVHRDILTHKQPLLENTGVPGNGIHLAEDVVVEEGVTFSGFASVGRRCVLKRNCSIHNAIIWDDVSIDENAVVKNAIVGRGFQINAG
jgi:NDP-sugar pyrophosphorylase family protein